MADVPAKASTLSTSGRSIVSGTTTMVERLTTDEAEATLLHRALPDELVTPHQALERMDPALRKKWSDEEWLRAFHARPATYGIALPDDTRPPSNFEYVGAAPASGGRGLVVVDAPGLLDYNLPPREPLLDPLIVEQGLTMLHAWRGLGKTQVAMGVAVAIATGTAYLRWSARAPQRVLYVDGELPLRVLQDRVRAAIARAGREPAPGFLRFVTPDLLGRAAPDLANLNDQALLDEAIGDTTKLVVLDNLSCLIRSGAAENDAESWVQVSDWLLHHRARGRAALIVHHSGKNGGQRGTSRREDLLDVVVALKKPQEWQARDGARFEVHFEKGRHLTGDQMEPFEAELDDSVPGGWTMRDLESNQDEKVVELLGLGLTLTDIARELGCHKSTVSRRVHELRSQGVLPPEGEKVRNKPRNTRQRALS